MKVIIGNYRSNLAGPAVIYLLSSALNAGVPFLIIPILTRALSPTDYGIIATFQVLVGVVIPFVGLSLHGAVARQYYDKEYGDLPRYVATCLLLIIACVVGVGLILWLGASPLSRLLVFPVDWLWSVLIVAFGQVVLLLALTLYQVQSKALQYGFLQLVITIINMGLSVWFVVSLDFDWRGRILAQVVAGALSLVLGIIILWRGGWIDLKVDFSHARSALSFGLPLVLHAFALSVMAASGRFFLNNLVGLETTGVYMVGFQVALMVGLVTSSFNTAFSPWLFERLAEGNSAINEKIVKMTYVYVLCVFGSALILIASAPWFLSFFVGEKFRTASIFIPWLVLGRAVEAIYLMTCNYIFYSRKTIFVSLATGSAAVINVASTYLFIRLNGAVGAAQASFVSSLVMAILIWFFAARLHPMPWLFFTRHQRS